MGGVPGCSIEHYIIKMLHFILTSMDGNRDAAVLAVPVDFSKAFNRMSHSDILCNLSDLNVPPCAIKLIQSYLSGRSMCVRYKATVSSFERCPGGGPQGGLLTGVLFILQVNKAGGRCPSPRQEQALAPTAYPTQSSQIPAPRQEDSPSPRQEDAQPPIEYQLLPHENPSTRQKNEIIPLCHQSKCS